jgi:hypothetical protein
MGNALATVYDAVTKSSSLFNTLMLINFQGLNEAAGQVTPAVQFQGNGKYLLTFDSNKTSDITVSVNGYQLNKQAVPNSLAEVPLTYAMQPIQGFYVQFQLTTNPPFTAPVDISVFIDIGGNPALPLQSGKINWGNGLTILSQSDLTSIANGGTAKSNNYAAAGSYSIACELVDSKNSTGFATIQVMINPGVAPIPVVQVTASAVWFLITANVSVLYPPPAGEAALSINWGDGSGSQPLNSNNIRVTHLYKKPGTYNISAELVFTAGAILSSNVWTLMVTAPPLDYIQPLLLSSQPGLSDMAYVVPLLL